MTLFCVEASVLSVPRKQAGLTGPFVSCRVFVCLYFPATMIYGVLDGFLALCAELAAVRAHSERLLFLPAASAELFGEAAFSLSAAQSQGWSRR